MLPENKIVGEILEIKSEKIMDYFKIFITKRLPARYFPLGFSEISLNFLKFIWINSLVLHKFESFMKFSLKADSIP